ncbi:hypothetical protein BG418_21060 [Streptomyces sp. CBMA152]|nr:hypothetical protein [Streptomyces sp. CBMA152]
MFRVSAAGEADGELSLVGFGLAGGVGGVGLAGGVGWGGGTWGCEGCCAGAEWAPAGAPGGTGFCGFPGRPPGEASDAPDTDPLGRGDADDPPDGFSPCLPGRPRPAPPDTPATPRVPAPASSRPAEAEGFGAFPSSLTLMQPADAATTSAVTAKRTGADNWRTGGLHRRGRGRVALPNSLFPAGDTPGTLPVRTGFRRVAPATALTGDALHRPNTSSPDSPSGTVNRTGPLSRTREISAVRRRSQP